MAETGFTCRSVAFSPTDRECRLSQDARFTEGATFVPDPGFVYIENLCMPFSELCPTRTFLVESGKRPEAALERAVRHVPHLPACTDFCTGSLAELGFLCRAFYLDEPSGTCVLYDVDPSEPAASTGDLYRLACPRPDRVRGAAAVNHPNYVSRLDGSVPPPPAGYAGDMRNGYGGGYSPYGSYGGWGAGPNYGGLSGSSSTITGGNYGGGPYGAQWGSGGSPPYGNTYGGPSYMRPPPPPPAAAPGGGNYGAPYGRYPPIQARPYPHPNLNSIDPCKSSSMGSFRKLGFKTRMRNFYVRRVLRADRIEECEKACVNEVDFICRAFNFKQAYPDNCELSDQDTRMLQLGNPTYFDQDSQYDYFERETFNPGGANRDCLDVSQTCSPDGMEFSVKTPDGFFGRIYTYGFYDSCFYDGNGGTLNVLRISRANGFPRCGTQQYGDVMTNIVVVQYNDYVQTSRDKKYNLTCYMSGPGETVVTSSYLDTRTDGVVQTVSLRPKIRSQRFLEKILMPLLKR
ncbi:hypothetical protein LAZ67_X000662 [Cordylochernes scorpioides]|uniref:Uncharacterized protein n=1 Tax=Cordylochernes scorpioides TaxID=51811 RepID=A0ABY6LUX9_9ARAC|nr:hypothetical protein LAZ67_X000662 [Cordylochernes scorpioides]